MKKNPLRWAVQHRRLLPYCVESLKALLLAKALILLLPHKHWGFNSDYFQCETLRTDLLNMRQEVAAISRTLALAVRYVPWRSKCLDQALAAQRMLKRRGLPSTLYLGMVKDNDNRWAAHAWVRCGDTWVIGYQPLRQYTVVGTYAKI